MICSTSPSFSKVILRASPIPVVEITMMREPTLTPSPAFPRGKISTWLRCHPGPTSFFSQFIRCMSEITEWAPTPASTAASFPAPVPAPSPAPVFVPPWTTDPASVPAPAPAPAPISASAPVFYTK